MSCHNLVAWSGESLFWIFFSYVKKLFDHEHVCPALIPKLIDENTGCSGGKEDSQQQQSTGCCVVYCSVFVTYNVTSCISTSFTCVQFTLI